MIASVLVSLLMLFDLSTGVASVEAIASSLYLAVLKLLALIRHAEMPAASVFYESWPIYSVAISSVCPRLTVITAWQLIS